MLILLVGIFLIYLFISCVIATIKFVVALVKGAFRLLPLILAIVNFVLLIVILLVILIIILI